MPRFQTDFLRHNSRQPETRSGTGSGTSPGLAKAIRWFHLAALAQIIAIACALLLFIGGFIRIPSAEVADFASFYAAGSIVREGHYAQLYSSSLQREIQQHFWPNFQGEFYFSFAYPPQLALIFWPFSYLTPFLARLTFGILSFFAFKRAFSILAQHFELPRQLVLSGTIILATSFPLLGSFLIGQNTPWSVLFFAITLAFLRGRYSWLSGISAALWLFKPQFGLPFAVLIAPFFSRSAWVGFVGTALGIFAINSAFFGIDWIPWWSQAAVEFRRGAAAAPGVPIVSLLGGMLPTLSLSGWIVWFLVLIALALWIVQKHRRGEFRFEDEAFLALAPFLVFLPPTVVYYDLGITLVATFFLLFKRLPPNVAAFIVLAIWAVLPLIKLLPEGTNFYWILSAVLCITTLGLLTFRSKPLREQ